jgi:hypothetical protein
MNSNLNPHPPSVPLSNPSSVPLSEESLKEYFLRNVNSDFVNDAPLLIEEKLKDLFSKFLCELSGTMETLPGTLLESCVMKLSSSVQEIITAEVIPALYDKVFKHLNEFPLPPNRNEQLQEFFNDKLDSLQDIIIGLNSENTSSIDSVKESITSMEHSLSSTLRAMRIQLSEAEDRENSRFEQTRRRLGDFHSSMNNMNHKLDLIVNSMQRNEPSSVRYNNPLMHEWQSQQAEPSITQAPPPPPPPPPPPLPPHKGVENPPNPRRLPEANTGTSEVRANTPQWEKDFPFIKHNDVDPEMRKE